MVRAPNISTFPSIGPRILTSWEAAGETSATVDPMRGVA